MNLSYLLLLGTVLLVLDRIVEVVQKTIKVQEMEVNENLKQAVS